MKTRQAIIYVLLVVLIFCSIHFFTSVFFNVLLDVYLRNPYIQLGIVVIFNILINPILTYIIVNRVKFINKLWK